MVTKTHKTAGETQSREQLSSTIKDSAQQIWLAGLGAFAKAQEEGTKVFDTLVKEGLSIQRKTQSAAEEKLTEATAKMAGMATDISSKASGQWSKMESIFEDRVSRALGSLGVPAAKEIEALTARVAELEASVRKLSATSGAKASAAAPRSAARPASTRVASRKTAARKAA